MTDEDDFWSNWWNNTALFKIDIFIKNCANSSPFDMTWVAQKTVHPTILLLLHMYSLL
jgi:hypothetical protein